MNDSQNNTNEAIKPMTREEILKNHQISYIPPDKVTQLFNKFYTEYKDTFDELDKRCHNKYTYDFF